MPLHSASACAWEAELDIQLVTKRPVRWRGEAADTVLVDY
jgi:hypothetical protein